MYPKWFLESFQHFLVHVVIAEQNMPIIIIVPLLKKIFLEGENAHSIKDKCIVK
jgi:hypothetical protein